jgi:hypothetical protein
MATSVVFSAQGGDQTRVLHLNPAGDAPDKWSEDSLRCELKATHPPVVAVATGNSHRLGESRSLGIIGAPLT